jgi:hypothetical protein
MDTREVSNPSGGHIVSVWASEYDVKLSKTSQRAQCGHYHVKWGQLISRLVDLALPVVEECQIPKTVEPGVPKAEEKRLQGDRCGKCQIVLTVEVGVGLSVDLTVDAK